MKRDSAGGESQLSKNAKRVITVIFIAAGPLSLIVFPLPVRIVLPFAILGFIAGGLWSFRDPLPALVAMLLVAVGERWLEQRAEASLQPAIFAATWQPIALVFSAMMIAYVAIRHAQRLPIGSD